jgi:hypothetical protein
VTSSDNTAAIVTVGRQRAHAPEHFRLFGSHRVGKFGFDVLARRLLPLLAAIAVVFSSIASFAAAGPTGEIACCCPVPDECKCHDHDTGPAPPTMKRCPGDVELVAPLLAAAIVGRVPHVAYVVLELPIELLVVRLVESQHWLDVETPPF